MICLLCYESNDESIVLDSDEGRQLNVSFLLFKYFQFCFNVSLALICYDKFINFCFCSSTNRSTVIYV